MNDRRIAYRVCWQYIRAGKESYQSSGIGLLYKRLEINIETKDVVYPGETAAVNVHVTDYKG